MKFSFTGMFVCMRGKKGNIYIYINMKRVKNVVDRNLMCQEFDFH